MTTIDQPPRHGRPRGSQPPYTRYRDEQLIKLYQSGRTLGEAGAAFAISASRVYQIFRRRERAQGMSVLRHDRGRPPCRRARTAP